MFYGLQVDGPIIRGGGRGWRVLISAVYGMLCCYMAFQNGERQGSGVQNCHDRHKNSSNVPILSSSVS